MQFHSLPLQATTLSPDHCAVDGLEKEALEMAAKNNSLPKEKIVLKLGGCGKSRRSHWQGGCGMRG